MRDSIMQFSQINPQEDGLKDFYISKGDPSIMAQDNIEEDHRPSKNSELAHLRKMQSVNFVERAAIRVVELFSHKDVAC
jgi:hypothetical protein